MDVEPGNQREDLGDETRREVPEHPHVAGRAIREFQRPQMPSFMASTSASSTGVSLRYRREKWRRCRPEEKWVAMEGTVSAADGAMGNGGTQPFR